MTDAHTSKERNTWRRLKKKLEEGCSRCAFDEAEGGLFNHCAVCQHSITTMAYELIVTCKGHMSFPDETEARHLLNCDMVKHPNCTRCSCAAEKTNERIAGEHAYWPDGRPEKTSERPSDCCMSAGCRKPHMKGSVLCQEHYDLLPAPMRGEENGTVTNNEDLK